MQPAIATAECYIHVMVIMMVNMVIIMVNIDIIIVNCDYGQ